MAFNPRWLIGRTITRVELNRFDPENGGSLTCDPVITFENGARLYFRVRETETGEYGIDPKYLKPQKVTL